jgi:Holliday junction resolvasome RuvABC DNA-binding subunit
MRNLRRFATFNENVENTSTETITSALISLGYTNKMATEMMEKHKDLLNSNKNSEEIASDIEEAEFEQDNLGEESEEI